MWWNHKPKPQIPPSVFNDFKQSTKRRFISCSKNLKTKYTKFLGIRKYWFVILLWVSKSQANKIATRFWERRPILHQPTITLESFNKVIQDKRIPWFWWKSIVEFSSLGKPEYNLQKFDTILWKYGHEWKKIYEISTLSPQYLLLLAKQLCKFKLFLL